MKLNITTITAIIGLLQTVLADSRPISVVSAHSASSVHLLPLHDNANGLLLGQGTDALGFTITDAGTIKLSNGKYIVVTADGYLTAGDQKDATTGWVIEHGTFALNGNQIFYAVPTSDVSNYQVAINNVAGSTFIHFIGATSDSNRDYTYTPKSASATIVNTTNSTTTTSAAPKSTITIAQGENMGNKLGLGFTAGIAGIAAILL